MVSGRHARTSADEAGASAIESTFQSPAGRRWVEWLSVALLLILTFTIYRSVAAFDFVNLDDDDYVCRNPIVTSGASLHNIRAAFRFRAANWHPVTWLSHMTDVEIFGLHAGRHHVVNAALHLVDTALLYAVWRRFTKAHWKSLLVAALFAVHPLSVETVAWIAERKSLLSTAAWLAALLAYGAWLTSRSTRHYVLLILLFAIGLMSKPMIITLPATLLIFDFWPLQRFRPDDFVTPSGRKKIVSIIVEKLPLLALSVVSALITYAAQSSWKAVTSFSISDRLGNAVVSTGWYLLKALLPAGLCVYYPHPSTIGQPVSWLVAGSTAIAITAIIAFAIAQARRHPYVLAGMTWYLVTLLPVLGIIQVGGQAHADRYAYVPLIGVFVAVVWLCDDRTNRVYARVPLVSFAVLALVVLSLVAHRQIAVWQNSETLYENALRATEGRNPVARRNLASYYTGEGNTARQNGDRATALSYFQRASAVDPASADALFNEAVVLSELGRYGEAIPRYRSSLKLNVANADGWLNLGDANAMTGQFAEAAAAYERVLNLRADKYADYGLAYVSAKRGDWNQASISFHRLRSVDPSLADDLRNRLGIRR